MRVCQVGKYGGRLSVFDFLRFTQVNGRLLNLTIVHDSPRVALCADLQRYLPIKIPP